jgi:hypothetical protein
MLSRDLFVRHSRAWLAVFSVAVLTFAAAGCDGGDKLSPSTENPVATAPTPGDSATIPVDSAGEPADSSSLPADSSGLSGDSTGLVPAATAGTQPGIVFGSYQMTAGDLNSIHTGTVVGGQVNETNVIQFLAGVKAKGGRVVLKMCAGRDSFVKNADGTFSLSKWKSLVDRFRKVNLNPYITDGTLVGHFLIDEPHRAARWGGKVISQATVETMAQYSKQIWPALPAIVRVVPSWLASAPVTYRALDAGWLQYSAGKGEAAQLVASETSIAKQKGLGLVVGINILDGGNGSSGVRGLSSGKWAMSANEIRNYGTALLSQSYACGFFNWAYNDFGLTYFARSDIKSALAALSTQATSHARTSCVQ